MFYGTVWYLVTLIYLVLGNLEVWVRAHLLNQPGFWCYYGISPDLKMLVIDIVLAGMFVCIAELILKKICKVES